jgi:hypothetical protein
MSSGDTDAIHYLTVRGWEAGPEPTDSVETWRRSVRNGHISWRCLWVDLTVQAEERDRLRAKYRASMAW